MEAPFRLSIPPDCLNRLNRVKDEMKLINNVQVRSIRLSSMSQSVVVF